MLAHEPGTCSGSEIYFFTQSQQARKLLFYAHSCGYYYTDYDYHIKRDYVQELLLFYICEGRLSIRCEDSTVIASAGQVCLLNCHKPHEYYTIGHTEFIWIHVYGSNTDALAEQIQTIYGSHVFFTSSGAKLKDAIYSFVYACRNEQIITDLQISQRIYGMLLLLLGGTPQRKGASELDEAAQSQYTDSVVEQAMVYTGEHYREDISVQDIADYVNMSQAHFSRLFKRQSGYSPHEYLIQVRINRAKHLLKTTELPIKTISQDVGYQDVTTFSSAFTNRVGLSPSKFRRYRLG